MAGTKQQVKEILRRLPDDCSLEDVQYELYVAQKVRRGLDAIDQGKGIPHNDAKKRMKKWLAK